MAILKQLSLILIPELIVLCVLVTYFWIDLQSVVTLLIFDFLFITLFTQLRGNKLTKLGLLAAGNAIGMVWNYSFHILILQVTAARAFSATELSVFYTVAYPFLNSFWIIAFWSLSLSALNPLKTAAWKPKA